MGARSTSRARRRALVAGAVAATIVVGVLFVAMGSPDQVSSASVAVDPPPSGGVVERTGRSAAFTPDRDGVATAAIAYATAAQRWLYLSDDEIKSAVAQIATPVASPRLSEEVVADVRAARARLADSPGRIWWLVRPMAWRVESFTSDEATVAVWIVTVLSAQEVAVPQSEWTTVTLQLAWEDSGWRVDAARDIPGDQPWDAVPFDETLAGFTRLDGEPVT
jgi:hypothetical protein